MSCEAEVLTLAWRLRFFMGQFQYHEDVGYVCVAESQVLLR